MHRDYGPLLSAWASLSEFEGYLDTQGMKQKAQATGHYNTLRNRLSFELYEDTKDWALAAKQVTDDLGSIAQQDPDWYSCVLALKEDLLARLEFDSRKKPVLRILSYYVAPITVSLAVIAWLGIWWFERVPIDHAVDTQQGIVKRAQAYDKAREFDNLQGGRGGLVKSIIISAWQPAEKEEAAAKEFVSIGMQGYLMLAEQRKACGLTPPLEDTPLADDNFEFLDRLSNSIQEEKPNKSAHIGSAIMSKIQSIQECP